MKKTVCVLTAVFALTGIVFAQAAPTAAELLRRVDDNEIYQTIEYEGQMIIEYQNRRYVKTMKAWGRANNDSFIEFTNREDSGTKYLKKDGRLYVYSPDTEEVMLISGHMLKESMMGSLGMTRREIVQVFFLEALFLSILGALTGCAAGGIVTFVCSWFPFDFNAMTGGGMKEFPISGTIYLDFSPSILAGGFVFGVVVAAICTLIPSLKSAFVEPVEALRR
jgi:hypothetical protein